MLPILYSFRRCPYAMRARLAIVYSGMQVELREVVLRDMPASLLEVSPRATVPVLVLPDARVIDESRDIMLWALQQHDPEQWLGEAGRYRQAADALLDENDSTFKQHLDHYKYADRYPEHPADYYRSQGEQFLRDLETRLTAQRYLLADRVSLADIGVFPFIRQFAFVDRDWFDRAPYPHLRLWLDSFLASSLFAAIMLKYPVWQPDDRPIVFPA